MARKPSDDAAGADGSSGSEDDLVTVATRIPRSARQQIVAMAKRADRNLSAQIRRLVLAGLEAEQKKG